MFHYIPFKLGSDLAFNAFKVLKKFVKHFKRLVGTSTKISLSTFNLLSFLLNIQNNENNYEEAKREERKKNKIIIFNIKKEFGRGHSFITSAKKV